MGPPGPLLRPLISQGGQRGACAKFGGFLVFLVLKAVQLGQARGGAMARSGLPADIKRACRPLLSMAPCLRRATGIERQESDAYISGAD